MHDTRVEALPTQCTDRVGQICPSRLIRNRFVIPPKRSRAHNDDLVRGQYLSKRVRSFLSHFCPHEICTVIGESHNVSSDFNDSLLTLDF